MDIDELTDVIGDNTRRFRQALGWSQDALASAAGLSKGTIVAIEQHRSNPSVGTLCALSETLGVGLATLLERPGGPLVKHRTPADAVQLWRTDAGSHAALLIGTDPPAGVELWRWTLAPGDEFFFLACDGLFDVLPPYRLSDDLMENQYKEPGDLARHLAETALGRNADNVTVAVMQLSAPPWGSSAGCGRQLIPGSYQGSTGELRAAFEDFAKLPGNLEHDGFGGESLRNFSYSTSHDQIWLIMRRTIGTRSVANKPRMPSSATA